MMFRMWQLISDNIIFALLLLVSLTMLGGCATHKLQTDTAKKLEYALPPTSSGALHDFAGRAARSAASDESVFLPLSSNMDALHWRILLIDKAQQSIDIQYYLIDRDEGSKLLGVHLLNAADRGVRVRILVDDVFLTGRDQAIADWNSHPNISIHVFNPWHKRGSLVQQGLEFLGYFERLNQRMHNKLTVVDGQVGITGGRNIGNAYFGLSNKYNFRDLEVIVTGPVVSELEDSFDLYWNDDWTMSAEAFADASTAPDLFAKILHKRQQAITDSEMMHTAGLSDYAADPKYLIHFIDNAAKGPAWVAYDDPPSAFLEDSGVRKVDQLEDMDADISRELIIVSPYFIPSEVFLGKLRDLTARGVRVVVLTNSLASTNHTMVNSGYSPWRKKLLEAGVELFEYRSDAANTSEILMPGVESKFISLHTKTFVIDRENVYIGSLNMDPRSFHLNTEMGLLINAPALAEQIAEQVEKDMNPDNAWRVSLEEDERLAWHSSAGTVYLQPARHFGQRILDFFYGLLPIKDQL
ncbi:MAG: phospholipase D family protein [Gammaproteobacteria bacterium]|nr:MAG: phospholipase D family protein [Gammaproteobacteria bacterium]